MYSTFTFSLRKKLTTFVREKKRQISYLVRGLLAPFVFVSFAAIQFFVGRRLGLRLLSSHRD
jgi:hypothetical protein